MSRGQVLWIAAKPSAPRKDSAEAKWCARLCDVEPCEVGSNPALIFLDCRGRFTPSQRRRQKLPHKKSAISGFS